MAGIQIGQLLVEQGVLTREQVDHILAVQKAAGRPFGDLAERLFGISPRVVEDAWVEQYVRTAGITDLESLEFDKQCLRTLSRRQAWQFSVLPVNKEDGQFQMATDADHLVRAVNFASRRIDQAVYFLIAEHDQLRDFLMRHYPVPDYLAEFAGQLRR